MSFTAGFVVGPLGISHSAEKLLVCPNFDISAEAEWGSDGEGTPRAVPQFPNGS